MTSVTPLCSIARLASRVTKTATGSIPLRAPLRRIDSFSRAVLESQGEKLDETGRHYLERVREASQHMSQLIDDVLYLSRVTRADLRDQEVDLSALANLILVRLQEGEPTRKVETKVRPGVVVTGDGQLLRIALENLLENAWKFTGKEPEARILTPQLVRPSAHEVDHNPRAGSARLRAAVRT